LHFIITIHPSEEIHFHVLLDESLEFKRNIVIIFRDEMENIKTEIDQEFMDQIYEYSYCKNFLLMFFNLTTIDIVVYEN
jgi:hypothetical protein